MATTTTDAIRDRMITVIGQTVPTVLTDARFRHYRNEADGNLIAYAQANPEGNLRAYQVRFDGMLGVPDCSNSDFEARKALFTVIIAYPQTAVYGKGQALDRDTAIERDQALLEKNIGLYGRANFTAPAYPDACFLDSSSRVMEGDGCDFLYYEVTMLFNRLIG